MSQSFAPVDASQVDMNPSLENLPSYYAQRLNTGESNGGDIENNEAQDLNPFGPSAASNITKKRDPEPAQPSKAVTAKTPRKNSKAKEMNEDGTPVPKPASARKKAVPKLDEDGNPIPRAPRKKAEPKPKLDADGEPIPKAARKGSAKKVKTESNFNDEQVDMMTMVSEMATAKVPGFGDETSVAGGGNYNNDVKGEATSEGSTSPAKATKGSATSKGKKSAVADGINGTPSGAPSTPANKKKRSAKSLADEDYNGDALATPSKKSKVAGTPKTGNGKGMAIATTRDQLTEEDKMMLQMKRENKTWPEIRKAWTEMTGKAVGGSTLPNRYSRIMANLTDWKEGDIERMLFAKDQISKEIAEEIEAQRKKLEGEVYPRMSALMVELGADMYTSAAIEKAYNKEKRDGFPHQETVEQVIGASAAAEADNDADMSGEGTAGEEGPDKTLPISPKHSSDADEVYQKGLDDFSPEDIAAMDAELEEMVDGIDEI